MFTLFAGPPTVGADRDLREGHGLTNQELAIDQLWHHDAATEAWLREHAACERI